MSAPPARYDRADETDQGGNVVSKDQAWSPRLSAAFDPKGSGKLTVHAGLARYVMPVTSGIVDLGSGAGRNGNFAYVYRGPAINTDLNTPNPVPVDQALTTIFNWFYANGGTSRPLRGNPTYPGVNRKLAEGLKTPSSVEYSVGLGGTLGSGGSYRVDAIYRDYDKHVHGPSGARRDRGSAFAVSLTSANGVTAPGMTPRVAVISSGLPKERRPFDPAARP